MLQSLILAIVGLIGLSVGAHFLIKGSRNIARRMGISEFFIGLALVSIGTSIPEIGVSIAGGIDRLAGIETSGIVVGNKVGSALGQLSLIFGILAFLVPLRMRREYIVQQGGFLIASVLLVFGLAADGHLSRADGFVALMAYAAYYAFLLQSNFKYRDRKPRKSRMVQNVVYASIGLLLVLVTSDIVVDSAIEVATHFNVHQSLIGILLVGLGTGLPELAVAIAAWRQRAMAISMGDLIGSNICDLLLSLGAGTIISGFLVDPVLIWFDLPVLLLLSCVILYFLYTGRRISKVEGAALIAFFVLYSLTKIFVTG